MSQSRAARLRRAHAQLRIRMQQERRLEAQLRAELVRVAAAAAAAYPLWSGVIPAHVRRVRAILESSLARTALMGVAHVRASMKSGAAVEVKLLTQQQLDARAVAVAKRRARDRVVDIGRTTNRRIFNTVQRGIESHDPPAVIARAIRDDVGGMSLSRARTIARTETAVAMNTAQNNEMQATAEELGLKMIKTWTATEDDRTRDSHRDADGQTVNLDGVFTVGGSELKYPSDPDGPPEEVINCRCAVLYDVR